MNESRLEKLEKKKHDLLIKFSMMLAISMLTVDNPSKKQILGDITKDYERLLDRQIKLIAKEKEIVGGSDEKTA